MRGAVSARGAHSGCEGEVGSESDRDRCESDRTGEAGGTLARALVATCGSRARAALATLGARHADGRVAQMRAAIAHEWAETDAKCAEKKFHDKAVTGRCVCLVRRVCTMRELLPLLLADIPSNPFQTNFAVVKPIPGVVHVRW